MDPVFAVNLRPQAGGDRPLDDQERLLALNKALEQACRAMLPDRERMIHNRRRAGESDSKIAADFGISEDQLRLIDAHVTKRLTQAKARWHHVFGNPAGASDAMAPDISSQIRHRCLNTVRRGGSRERRPRRAARTTSSRGSPRRRASDDSDLAPPWRTLDAISSSCGVAVAELEELLIEELERGHVERDDDGHWRPTRLLERRHGAALRNLEAAP